MKILPPGAAPSGGPRVLPWLCAGGLLLVLAGLLVHLSGADPAWMLRVHASAPSALSSMFWSVTTVMGLGSCAVICVLAVDRGSGRVAALLPAVFLLGGVLTHAVKWLLAVPRPAGTALAPQLHVIGSAFRGAVSMPSGHALTAAATAALVCLALPARRPLAVLLIGAAAGCIAWSRVVVGAHWPSDVLVGAGLGLLAVAACLAGWERGPGRRLHAALARRIAAPTGQRWVAVVELATAAVLLEERTGYPAGLPTVVALAILACASAAWRWRVARDPRGLRTLRDAPVERS